MFACLFWVLWVLSPLGAPPPSPPSPPPPPDALLPQFSALRCQLNFQLRPPFETGPLPADWTTAPTVESGVPALTTVTQTAPVHPPLHCPWVRDPCLPTHPGIGGSGGRSWAGCAAQETQEEVSFLGQHRLPACGEASGRPRRKVGWESRQGHACMMSALAGGEQDLGAGHWRGGAASAGQRPGRGAAPGGARQGMPGEHQVSQQRPLDGSLGCSFPPLLLVGLP